MIQRPHSGGGRASTTGARRRDSNGDGPSFLPRRPATQLLSILCLLSAAVHWRMADASGGGHSAAPAPDPNGSCDPCTQGVNLGAMTVYCCNNLFISTRPPNVICANGKGPFTDKGTCKIPLYQSPPPPFDNNTYLPPPYPPPSPPISPPNTNPLPPSVPPSPVPPPPPRPPSACPERLCTGPIETRTFPQIRVSLWCCGSDYVLVGGSCVVCTSVNAKGPFLDRYCSQPLPHGGHCGAASPRTTAALTATLLAALGGLVAVMALVGG